MIQRAIRNQEQGYFGHICLCNLCKQLMKADREDTASAADASLRMFVAMGRLYVRLLYGNLQHCLHLRRGSIHCCMATNVLAARLSAKYLTECRWENLSYLCCVPEVSCSKLTYFLLCHLLISFQLAHSDVGSLCCSLPISSDTHLTLAPSQPMAWRDSWALTVMPFLGLLSSLPACVPRV